MDKFSFTGYCNEPEVFFNHLTGMGFIGTKFLKHLSLLILLFVDLLVLNRFLKTGSKSKPIGSTDGKM